MTDEEFDIEDLLYYRTLSPKEKLDYLEEMNLSWQKITPPEAIKMNERLKDEGY